MVDKSDPTIDPKTLLYVTAGTILALAGMCLAGILAIFT